MVAAQIALIAQITRSRSPSVLFGATTLIVRDLIDNLANGGRAAVLRLGVRPDRPRTHHGHRIHRGGIAYWLLGTAGTTPWTFRDLRGADLLHLGRDLQPVSRRPAPIRSVPNTPPPTTACSTPRRDFGLCWCRSRTSLKAYTGNWHAVFVVAVAMNFTVVRWRCSWSSRCGFRSASENEATGRTARRVRSFRGSDSEAR